MKDLSKNYALKGKPIQCNADLRAYDTSGKFITRMREVDAAKIDDEEWISLIKNNWWYHEKTYEDITNDRDKALIDKRLFELRDRLLTFGGSEVCLPASDEDLIKILDRGQIWFWKPEMKKGLPSQCHRNSSVLWNRNKDFANGTLRICTGYALSDDGMWRQHSWLVYKTSRSVRVVETTIPRLLYFGFVMDDEECQEFYENCV